MFSGVFLRQALTMVTVAVCMPFFGCGSLLSKPTQEWPEPQALIPDQTSVWSLAYSPDGRYIVSSHVDQRPIDSRSPSGFPGPAMIRLWGTSCPLLPCEPEEHLATYLIPDWEWVPHRHQFSADGQYVFTTTNHGVLRWHITEQRLDKKLIDCRVTLSPDGRVAVGMKEEEEEGTDDLDALLEKAGNREVVMWNLDDERQIAVLGTVSSFGSPVQFLPDGQRLLTLVGDPLDSHEAVIWHLPTRTKTRLDAVEVYRVSFAADGQRLAAFAEEDEAVHVLNTHSGQRMVSVPSWEKVRCIALSPDGSALAMGGESLDESKRQGEIQIWNVGPRAKTAELRKKLVDRATWGITAICFSPDGKSLVSGDGDGVIKTWHIPAR